MGIAIYLAQALGWQIVAAKTAMRRVAASSQWLHERIFLSRYAHVPLGNFELDWLIYTIDNFFSRALRDKQQILWISDNGIPDLGGFNEEDSCYADEVHQPVLVFPGAYRKVSVELKIHHLAVDALLKTSKVHEIEGNDLFGLYPETNPEGQISSEQYSFDETTCGPAFLILKQLVKRCLEDVMNSQNVLADAVLQHFYRWLCRMQLIVRCPSSKLHDPAIHRMLHKVMQKVFALLVADFRKLGATIIFANFSKIIIDTGKAELSAAKAYCESLLGTIQKRDLFEWIVIEPQHSWHSLLFMDEYNYGGIQASNQKWMSASQTGPTVGDFIDNSELEPVWNWSIANHLPKTAQDHFFDIISDFIEKPWKYAKEQAAIRASVVEGDSCTPSITAAAAEKLEGHLTDYLRDQISSYFADQLFGVVGDLVKPKSLKRMKKDEAVHSSENGYKGDAALEFIKHVCAVLALDQNVQHEVLVIRKNLLKYLHVKEFAPESQFTCPSQSFTIPNVFCSYCSDCRDLELGRDPDLLTQEWGCLCGQPYDREIMENSLLQIVRQRERLYHLQDLVCVKCNMVKDSHLSEQCTCAGTYTCTEPASEFYRKMRILRNIAVHQNFELLQECVSWILGVK